MFKKIIFFIVMLSVAAIASNTGPGPAKLGGLPDQSGHTGEVLTTSGSTLYWSAAGSGSVTNVQSTDGSIDITNPTTTPNLSIHFPMIATTGGSVTGPAYAFGNSGMWASAYGALDFSTSGVNALSIDNNQQAIFTNTVAADDFIYPAKSAHTFLAGPTSGSAIPSFRAIAAGDIGAEDIPYPLAGDGDATTPDFGTPGGGMYGIGFGVIGFSTLGTERLRIENNGSVEIGNGGSGSLTVNGDGTFTGNISAANYPPGPPTGNSYGFAGYDTNGDLYTIPAWSHNDQGGWGVGATVNPDDNTGNTFNSETVNYNPIQNSPDENWLQHNWSYNIDTDSDGFDFGTNGAAGTILNMGYNHQGKSNTGALNMINTNSNIGNGTDPITVKGLGTFFGFNNIASGVTIDGQLQGYGMQYTMASGSTLTNNVQAFYDFNNLDAEVHGYGSFKASPTIDSVANNTGVTFLDINPTITTFNGNSNLNWIGLSGNIGTFGTGGLNGLIFNPTVTSTTSAYGLWVSMDNITASGDKKAAYLDGDVEITGDLTFGGTLAIGTLNAFGSLNPVIDGGGNPTSVHTLFSQIISAPNTLTANADTFGINTAALITISSGSTLTSGALGIGQTALALPAVIETQTGGSTDFLGASLFALSFSGTSTGGTIDQAYGARWVAIPNGITTVNDYKAIWASMPFGDISSSQWGLYIEDFAKNFIEGALQVMGGIQLSTSGSQPTCDSDHRGMLWNVEGGAGVADQLQICQKNAADAYVWNNLP